MIVKIIKILKTHMIGSQQEPFTLLNYNMEATQEKTPLELLQSGKITNLEQLFIATDTNFTNLWERLGLKSKDKLTRIKNNPERECSFENLKDISQITGIKATILLQHLRLGAKTVFYDEYENLLLEEIITPKA